MLALKAVNCQNGDTIVQGQSVAGSKEDVLNVLGRMASKLRRELGESLTSVQHFDVALPEATTSSLEALKAYSAGEKTLREEGLGIEALPQYERAIQLDPGFAMAYRAAGLVFEALGQRERASAYQTQAFQARTQASQREKLSIEAAYYSTVTGELGKAAQVYQEEIASYPRDAIGYSGLAGVYSELGLFEKATTAEQQGLALAPDLAGAYELLANYSLASQRLDEARRIVHQAQTHNVDSAGLRADLYALGFLSSDSASMRENLDWLQRKPGHESTWLQLSSDTEAYAGHLSKARELSNRAVTAAIHADNKEAAAVSQALAAQREAVYGNRKLARQLAEQSLQTSPGSPSGEPEAALALALLGDVPRAESLARDLETRFPLDTQMQSLWLPPIRAEAALDREKPDAALTLLQSDSPLEAGNIQFLINVSCMYSVYVRGEAYLASGRGADAAAEFQRILDHGGTVWNCWTGALARLQLARAYLLLGDRPKAKQALQEFLNLWRDADADIPILQRAKAEYAKLA